jgi:hypothetical protein
VHRLVDAHRFDNQPASLAETRPVTQSDTALRSLIHPSSFILSTLGGSHFAKLAIVGKVTFEGKTAKNTGKTSNIAKFANFAKFARRRFFLSRLDFQNRGSSQ